MKRKLKFKSIDILLKRSKAIWLLIKWCDNKKELYTYSYLNT